MNAGGVGQDREQHPTLVGQQELARPQVGVPLQLHRVGHVEPFLGPAGVVDDEAGTGVTVEVGDAQPGAPGEPANGVAAGADRLVPQHDIGRHAVGQAGGGRRRNRRLRGGHRPGLGPGVGLSPERARKFLAAQFGSFARPGAALS